jgi:hypothetical protein
MMLQALNTESGAEYDLSGPIGQVYAMETTLDFTLFAGGQVITMLTFAFFKFSIRFDFVSGFDYFSFWN